MRCPNGYRQNPPKSGNCVAKTAKKMSLKKDATSKSPKKRCKKGTRKNKLGECIPHNKGKNIKSVKTLLDEVLLDDIQENNLDYAKKNFTRFKDENIELINESIITIQTMLNQDPDFDKEDINAYLEKNGLLNELYKFDKKFYSKSFSNSSKSSSMSSKSTYSPKFYDVADKIFSNYKKNKFIQNKERKDKDKKVQSYIDKHKTTLNPGDILFVGSTNESRQYEESFVIISNDYKGLKRGDGAVHLPVMFRTEIPENINYKKMFDDIEEKMIDSSPDEDDYLMYFDFFNTVEGQEKENIQDAIHEYETLNLL